MNAVEHSSRSVESQLSALEDAYGQFHVTQVTISVDTEEYERRRNSGCDEIELYAKVTNDASEVLHVDTGYRRVLPSTTVAVDRPIEEALRSHVAETAGVDCRIEEIAGVTILGIRDGNDSTRNTVSRLAVLFEARAKGRSLDDAR